MKKILLFLAFLSTTLNAQVVYETRIYQEPDLKNVTINPYPPSYIDAKIRSWKIQRSPRIIFSTPVRQVVPTGSVTAQDQAIINLIK